MTKKKNMAALTYHEMHTDSPDERGSFWRTVLDILSSGGGVNPDFGEIRYPKNAQKQDLERIGQDFSRTLSKFDSSKLHRNG